MKSLTSFFAAIALLFVLVGPAFAAPSQEASSAYFVINSVSPNGYIVLSVYNFPANSAVKVYMDAAGNPASSAALVGTFTSGTATEYRIEMATAVRNQHLGVIRVEAPAAGIYLSSTFVNVASTTAATTSTTTTTTTSSGTGGPVIIPTIEIVAVDPDVAVTIRTHNFPVGDTFDAMLGKFGTLGINGTVMSTFKTAAASQVLTFDIPAGLKGKDFLAIRLESDASGYFSYDWFVNLGSDAFGTGGPVTTATSSSPSTAIPTFSIQSVVADGTVTVLTRNLPANDTYVVTMNTFGTNGVGGTKVDTVSTGTGGTLTLTFTIPAGLKGLDRIAVRMQSTTTGYYAFNWFWNSTAP